MEARYKLLEDYSEITDSREVELSQVNNGRASEAVATIECARCRLRLSYPVGSSVVKCPKCSTITATQSLSRTNCPFCRKQVMYPSQETVITCTCGMSFRVS